MLYGVENQISCRYAMAKELKSAVARSRGNDALAIHVVILVFLIACYATTPRFIGPSVRLFVRYYFFWVFAVFGLTAPAQMIK